MLGLKLSSSASAADEMGGRERTCVKLRGLPWSATADTVVDFFGDLREDIVTGGVHIVLNSVVSKRRPSVFSSPAVSVSVPVIRVQTLT